MGYPTQDQVYPAMSQYLARRGFRPATTIPPGAEFRPARLSGRGPTIPPARRLSRPGPSFRPARLSGPGPTIPPARRLSHPRTDYPTRAPTIPPARRLSRPARVSGPRPTIGPAPDYRARGRLSGRAGTALPAQGHYWSDIVHHCEHPRASRHLRRYPGGDLRVHRGVHVATRAGEGEGASPVRTGLGLSTSVVGRRHACAAAVG